MNRCSLQMCVLLLAFLAIPQASAQIWVCPMKRENPPDCGLFPHDQDIMVIPPGEQAVVARWYKQINYFSRHAYHGLPVPPVPLRGIRIFNNLDHPLPVFLRTRQEFDSFLEFAEKEPGISTCNVVDGVWDFQGCIDENRRPVPCPWHPGAHAVRELFHCRGAEWSCGGRCYITGWVTTLVLTFLRIV